MTMYYFYNQQSISLHPNIAFIGNVGNLKDSKVLELKNLEITDKWNRNEINLRNVIKARNNISNASDHTFEYWKDKKQWSYFVSQHYDWYMFPWKANQYDSWTANKYSLLKGDIVDLILTQNFIDRYIHSIETLIECKNKSIHDPINSKFVHPARHPKLLCSIQYFINVADFINDTNTSNRLNKLKKTVIQTFGDVECTICDDHIWSNYNR
eukprot:298041_1